jgi:hypothetical protein
MVTWTALRVAATPAGAAGKMTGAEGVTPEDCDDGWPSPPVFTAVTWYR